MSVIKRLGNLGKGLWSLNTKGEDAESKARIEALRREMEATEVRPRSKARATPTPRVDEETPAEAPTTGPERGPDGTIKRTL